MQMNTRYRPIPNWGFQCIYTCLVSYACVGNVGHRRLMVDEASKVTLDYTLVDQSDICSNSTCILSLFM